MSYNMFMDYLHYSWWIVLFFICLGVSISILFAILNTVIDRSYSKGNHNEIK